MVFIPDEGAVERFAPASPDPAFGDHVRVRRPHPESQCDQIAEYLHRLPRTESALWPLRLTSSAFWDDSSQRAAPIVTQASSHVPVPESRTMGVQLG
jgi:hypothetical protein